MLEKLQQLWIAYRVCSAMANWNSHWGSSAGAEENGILAHEKLTEYNSLKEKLGKTDQELMSRFEAKNPLLPVHAISSDIKETNQAASKIAA